MPTFDLGRLLDKLMREIFDERKLTKSSREKLWNKYFDYFSSAVDVGYKPSFKYYSKELAANLLANMSQFSAFKARSFEKSLAESLIDSKGRVSWSDFKKAGASINADYNKRWLKTEYHQTVATANMAGKWQDFQRTKELYPNLKYETVGDLRVRPKHKEWDGIVLPIDHPWWKTHYPPNDWGCRCDVTRTDEPASTHIPNEQLKIEFKNNAAQSGKIFNKSAYEEGLTNREKQEALLFNSKQRRVELLKTAKGKYKNMSIYRSEIEAEIRFSNTALKEYLNQPHKFKYQKDELVLSLDQILKKSKFIQTQKDFKQNPMVRQIHIFETVIEKEKSYLIVREMTDGRVLFYSISDSENVIEKK